jgi:hypothetical protein
MLTLHELRHICKVSSIEQVNFRTLLTAALIFDKDLIGEILYNSNFSLSKLTRILKTSKEDNAEEERFLIEIIKQKDEPSDLHLLRILCDKNTSLSQSLTKEGLSFELLVKELDRHILSSEKNVIGNNDFIESSLTRFTNIQLN